MARISSAGSACGVAAGWEAGSDELETEEDAGAAAQPAVNASASAAADRRNGIFMGFTSQRYVYALHGRRMRGRVYCRDAA